MRGALLACALALAACAPAPDAAQTGASAGAALTPTSLPAFFDCLGSEGATIVAAHRGGPAPGYAENAIATFEHTIAQAPVALEIDVRRTKDGVLVLMHDDTVDRTTDGRGPVYALTAAEFAVLRLRDESGAVLDQRPPSLREALDWAAGKTILELDVKRGVPIGEVARAIAEAGAEDRVLIITYTAAEAIGAHRAAPNVMISATIYDVGALYQLVRADVDLSRILAWTGTREPNSALNAALASRGVESLFGTLGDWDERFARGHARGYAEFAETGIELIATDRPAAAFAALDAADGEGWKPARCLAAR